MQELFTGLFGNLSEFFKSLDTTRKLVVLGVIGAIVVALVLVFGWASQTKYKSLYTNLNKEDSTQIARLLETKKISYQLSEDGSDIKIPEDQVDILRLELAKSGVSFTGTVGYEIFDKQPFGTTSFVQKLNKQRALEGELIKTIQHLRGVARSRVHLSIPENSPFVTEKKPPTASVVLELENGVHLTTEEINGVASLVASSLDGMRPENVVIIDSRGKKLSENISDSMAYNTANRMSLESKVSRQYESQIQEILSKVAGEGKIIAKVSVNMDFTESVSTETSFDGENSAVLSEVTNNQKLKGSRPSPQGIPGARSNLPGETPQPGVPETTNDVDKNLITKNYNVPSKVTKTVNPAAMIKNITAAVMVDGKQIPVLDKDGNAVLEDGVPKTKYEPWTEAEISNFKSIIASSIGLNEKRGDMITIKNMEFAKEDLAQVDAIMRSRENREIVRNLIKYLVVGVIISMFFFLVVRPFIQWVTENTIESVEDFLPRTIEELEKVQVNQKLPGLEDALPQIEEKLNPEKIEGNMLKEKIISLIENNPQKAAQVIHDMIHTADNNKEIA